MNNKEKETFNADEERENIVNWIREWFSKNGPDAKAVIGISGGKDSTIAAALLAEALGPDRVVGLIMPDGDMPDLEDAKRAARICGIDPVILDIHPAVSAFLDTIGGSLTEQACAADLTKKEVYTNVPPRVRMTTLYMVAQSLPCGGRVANTCNLSEDYVGYSTKGGDSVGDFSLFGELTASEVIAIGDALGLPYDLVHKAPADGLTGHTDEDNFGFSYQELDRYIRTGECLDSDIRKKIDHRHTSTMHKRRPMPTYELEDPFDAAL